MQETPHKSQSKRYKKSLEINVDQKMITKRSSKKYDNQAALKVVYISTPMKVTTSASNFRETVQELTGRESDVVKIMDSYGGQDTNWMFRDRFDHPIDKQSENSRYFDYNSNNYGVKNKNNNNNNKGMMISDYYSEEKSVHKLKVLNNNHDDGSSISSDELIMDPFDGVFDHSTLLFDQFCQQLDVLGTY
ncbi:unnamed protein product [Amaranthus hypochondriacus]